MIARSHRAPGSETGEDDRSAHRTGLDTPHVRQPPVATANNMATDRTPSAGARVVIADDSRYVRQMLATMLEQNGYKIAGEAEDGLQAVVYFRELRPDVTIIDLSMPRMNGLDALRTIRTVDPLAIVIVSSVSASRDTVLQALKAGATDFVPKPARPGRLLDAIAAALSSSRSHPTVMPE